MQEGVHDQDGHGGEHDGGGADGIGQHGVGAALPDQAAGVGYGLYSILGTVALRKYSPYTVTTYTFLLAAAGSWLVCQPADMISKFSAVDNLMELLLFCVLTGLVTAVIPFLAYTLGLRTVEASRAGILATIEPLVATLVGILVFSEPLTLLSGLGIILILVAVILLNRKQNSGNQP